MDYIPPDFITFPLFSIWQIQTVFEKVSQKELTLHSMFLFLTAGGRIKNKIVILRNNDTGIFNTMCLFTLLLLNLL